ncbi:MAG: hypothetical protein ABIP38_06425, partial [Steroidobacteraceae bacterium]
MNIATRITAAPVLLLFLLGACTVPASHTEPVASPITSQGASPEFPSPSTPLIPTLKIAKAKPWPAGLTPIPAPRLRVRAFASGLQH